MGERGERKNQRGEEGREDEAKEGGDEEEEGKEGKGGGGKMQIKKQLFSSLALDKLARANAEKSFPHQGLHESNLLHAQS